MPEAEMSATLSELNEALEEFGSVIEERDLPMEILLAGRKLQEGGEEGELGVGVEESTGVVIARCQAGKLLDFLMRMSGVAEKNGVPPSSKYVRLVRHGAVLTGLCCGSEVEIEAEDSSYGREGSGAANVEFWPTVKLLKGMRRDEDVELVQRAKDSVLRGKKNKYPITTMTDDLYVGSRQDWGQGLIRLEMNMVAGTLWDGLRCIKHAMGDGENESDFNGVWLTWHGEEVVLVAETAERAVWYPLLGVMVTGPEGAWQMRCKTVIEAERMLKGHKGGVGIKVLAHEGRHVMEMKVGKSVLRSELIDGVSWREREERIHEMSSRRECFDLRASVQVPRRDLVDALKRLGGDGVVGIAFGDEAWELVSGSDEVFAEEEIHVEGAGKALIDLSSVNAFKDGTLEVRMNHLMWASMVRSSFSMTVAVMVGRESGRLALVVSDEENDGFVEWIHCVRQKAEEKS